LALFSNADLIQHHQKVTLAPKRIERWPKALPLPTCPKVLPGVMLKLPSGLLK
jgi:hypothetical protein